jgi:hypothetical protein
MMAGHGAPVISAKLQRSLINIGAWIAPRGLPDPPSQGLDARGPHGGRGRCQARSEQGIEVGQQLRVGLRVWPYREQFTERRAFVDTRRNWY